MPYKKYIKRGGKTYGPYIYHSKRVGGKVVSEYHGPKKTNGHKKYVWVFALTVLAFLFAFFLATKGMNVSGNAILDLNANYNEGEPLEGILEFSLSEGEFLPASSEVIFENDGKKYAYPVEEIFSEEPVEGDYYVEGTNISGSGLGYGNSGDSTVYPAVYFTLEIYSKGDENGTEENLTEDKDISEVEEVNDSESDENSGNFITGNIISDFFSRGSGITGNVVLNLNKEIEGEVSSGNPFYYELSENEVAELRPKSVRTDSKELPDGILDINDYENGSIIVTTDYSEKGEGYGSDYAGNNVKKYEVDLNNLDLRLKEGELSIKLVYSEEEIFSLNTYLDDSSKKKDDSTDVSEDSNEVSSEEDFVQNQNAEVPKIEKTTLTSEEREALLNEFEEISIERIRNEVRGDRLIIGYQLREHRVEFVYDYPQDNSTLKELAENDRTNWLKDIAQKLILKNNESSSYSVEGIVNEDYSI